MPSFFVPARDSRHRAACFALYRALLRQVPRISLPYDVVSRVGWAHPIRYLVRTGFRRNKNDTSPRLVASALKSGYRFLTLLTRARDASSPQHAEIVAFLRQRQSSIPPPTRTAPSRPPPASSSSSSSPSSPSSTPPGTTDAARPRLPPLLTKISGPGEKPVYRSTFRPRPLAELTGGVRKVPVLDDTNNIGFLRLGKPQSHWHANFLRRKGDRRQARITAVQELWEDARPAAAEEDAWEDALEALADEEGVDIPDVGDEGGSLTVSNRRLGGRMMRFGPYERALREFGVDHLRNLLTAEADDMVARAKAMLDIVEEERKLAELEKMERREKRFRAWEERMRQSEQGEQD